jgi:hypothetical protein
MAVQIASSTALALLRHTPTPSAIRHGHVQQRRHPARLPKSSVCPKMKNVLAEQVARMKRLALKT